MAAASSPAVLLKSPSLLALLLIQVSLLWQRLFEVGRAAALPVRLRLLEATQAARLAVITALQDPDWLGEASSSGVSSAAADSVVGSAVPGGSAGAGANATPGPAGATGWWERLPAAPANGFSKNGEDGILSYIFEHVHVTNKFYVDLGADAGHGSNTEMLRKVGWKGWMINRENQNQATGVYLEKLFPDNVMAVFNKYKMPRLVDLLVIDLDSNDAHVLHALWQAGVRPRVVMIETNNNFGEDSVLSFPAGYKFLTHQWTSCGQVCTRILDSGKYQRVICGASVRGLARMAELFDYFPTYLNKMNLFLIRGDLVPKAMRKTWTFDDVLKRSRGLGRKALPFPRKDCMPFMDGLVPLVEPSPAAAKATPDAAKPTAAAKLPVAATKPAPAAAKPAPAAAAKQPPAAGAKPVAAAGKPLSAGAKPVAAAGKAAAAGAKPSVAAGKPPAASPKPAAAANQPSPATPKPAVAGGKPPSAGGKLASAGGMPAAAAGKPAAAAAAEPAAATDAKAAVAAAVADAIAKALAAAKPQQGAAEAGKAKTAKPPGGQKDGEAPPRWWVHMPTPPRRVYSKDDEDGILEYILKNVKQVNKQYVELPAGDGSAASTRLLREEGGWRGLLMDCCNDNLTIDLHKEDISPESIVGLFLKHKVPRELDLLALGAAPDSAFILKSIFQGGYRPRILILEVNANFGNESVLSFPDRRTLSRSSSPCGPVCTFAGEGGAQQTVLCGAGVHGMFLLAKSASYYPAYAGRRSLFLLREDMLSVPMMIDWTFSRMMNHSKKLGREHLPFPREECQPFMKGLVEITPLGHKGPEAVDRWWERLPAKPRKVFSQNCEDGILLHIFQYVKPANKQYFEFGSGDGTETNTRFLRQLGWTGTNLDQGFEDPSINLFKEFVTPYNIADILMKYKVLKEVDIFSIDVESFDLHMLRSVLVAGYRPRVIIVESNDNLGEETTLTFPSTKVLFWNWHARCGQTCTYMSDKGTLISSFCGASVRGLTVLAASAGYRPLYLNSVNLFLIRGDVLPAAAARNWTLEAVLQRSRGLGRRKLAFPREECGNLHAGLVEAEPLPPSEEAIPLDQVLEVPPAPREANADADAGHHSEKATGEEKTGGAAEEGSVTAWLKAIADAKGGHRSESGTGEEKPGSAAEEGSVTAWLKAAAGNSSQAAGPGAAAAEASAGTEAATGNSSQTAGPGAEAAGPGSAAAEASAETEAATGDSSQAAGTGAAAAEASAETEAATSDSSQAAGTGAAAAEASAETEAATGNSSQAAGTGSAAAEASAETEAATGNSNQAAGTGTAVAEASVEAEAAAGNSSQAAGPGAGAAEASAGTKAPLPPPASPKRRRRRKSRKGSASL